MSIALQFFIASIVFAILPSNPFYMRSKYVLTILFAITCANVNGQTFINGNLEGSASPCTYVINTQFPTFLSQAGYAFGTAMLDSSARISSR